jgi:hypothetical protein
MEKPLPVGPDVQDNWKAMLGGQQVEHGYECPFFGDAHVISEITIGPYEFINPVSMAGIGLVQPIVVLRYFSYIPYSVPSFEKTDSLRYHAGSFAEEVAALASLAMGIRLRAGSANRMFFPGGDPKGRPLSLSPQPAPLLMVSPAHHKWVIPGATGEHSLELLKLLESLPEVSSEDAIALIRAARSYQESLWLCETEPELAWLLLVSALETAANQWRASRGSAVERLEASKPEFFLELSGFGVSLTSRVAEEFVDSLGSAKKFVDFVIAFLPSAPKERPPSWAQVDWNPDALRKTLQIVYKHRSKALHESSPFPAPMCDAPGKFGNDWTAKSEKPISVASGQAGNVWIAKDTPLLLHTFEYIARNVLIGWWKSLGKPAT